MDQPSTDSPIATFMSVTSAPYVWAYVLWETSLIQHQVLAYVDPISLCRTLPARRALLIAGLVIQMDPARAVAQLLTSES